MYPKDPVAIILRQEMRSVPFLVRDDLTVLVFGDLVIQTIALDWVIAYLELRGHSASGRSDPLRYETVRIDILQPIKMGFALVRLVAIPKAVLCKQFLREANQPQVIVQ
jgi:hypothetical protein